MKSLWKQTWCQGTIFSVFTVGEVRKKVTSITKHSTLVWLQKKLWHYTTCRHSTFHNKQTSKGKVCSHTAAMGLYVLFFRHSWVSQKSQHAEALSTYIYWLSVHHPQACKGTFLSLMFDLPVTSQGNRGVWVELVWDIGLNARSWDFPGFLAKICSCLPGKIPTGFLVFSTFFCMWQDAESLIQLII